MTRNEDRLLSAVTINVEGYQNVLRHENATTPDFITNLAQAEVPLIFSNNEAHDAEAVLHRAAVMISQRVMRLLNDTYRRRRWSPAIIAVRHLILS